MIVANGSTDVTTYFVLRDATTHAPKTDVTLTDVDLYYLEDGAAISAKADVTALAAADSAHGDNKAFHVGQGLYRIDWPDAAFDGGEGKKVQLVVVCTGVDTEFQEVALSPSVVAATVGDKTGYRLSATGVDDIHDEAVEGAYTLRQALRVLLSFAAGKTTGGNTTSITFRDVNDSANRVVMTVDADGDRSAVTLTVT